MAEAIPADIYLLFGRQTRSIVSAAARGDVHGSPCDQLDADRRAVLEETELQPLELSESPKKRNRRDFAA